MDADLDLDALKLLPGIDEAYVRARLAAAGGNELASGKLLSADSSAALAVNALAWFHDRPELLPPVPGTEAAGWPAEAVDIESCARFPWAGGRHPWLDGFVVTSTHILGIESKRHEPFRDAKKVDFSDAYDRPVWGPNMGPFEALRDALRAGTTRFAHVDAAQLVKHAFGLVTESARRGGRTPVLVYVHDEPARWPAAAIAQHREELATFAHLVAGAAVTFTATRWSTWLATWTAHDAVRDHAARLRSTFDLAGG